MQFVGCYSFRSMTLEELKNYEGQNDIKIRTNQKETLINRKSSENGSINWYPNDSSIVVETRESISLEDYSKLSSQDIEQLNHTLEIKYNEIIGIEIDEVFPREIVRPRHSPVRWSSGYLPGFRRCAEFRCLREA